MVTTLSIDVIVSDPNVRGGRPIIAGTGIRVQDIAVAHIFAKMAAEEIAAAYKLDASKVFAALSYYYLHKADFDALLRADREEANRLRDELRQKGRLLELE